MRSLKTLLKIQTSTPKLRMTAESIFISLLGHLDEELDKTRRSGSLCVL